MADAKRWNPDALEASLAQLQACPPRLLHGRHGRLVSVSQRRSELRVLWLAFEEYEGLPFGNWRASPRTILAFLEWADLNPRFRREGPR